MEYHEAANFLFDLRRFRPKPGTESTAAFLEHLGNPHDGVDCIQIAGSNGKGSTARMLERSLRETGLSVGLYTSPHLDDLRERIRIDGRKIPRADVCEFVERAREYVTDRAADGESPTFFETMTTLALWQFGREDVDVAVLEVGIGGRYDATSVVDPIASAVTSVSLEHTSVIGETRAEIARDKAHVAPADASLVTAVEGDALAAVEEVADDVVTVGTDENADVEVEYGGRVNHTEATVTVEGDGWDLETRLSMLGAHQAENAGIAATLTRQVADVSRGDLEWGLRNAHWPGRFEVIETEPLVVLDGAHNPGACERLAETLSSFAYDDLHLVVGAMHEKDHQGMAEALPTPDVVTACRPALDRAEDETTLATVFERAGVDAVETEPDVADAFAGALAAADADDCVLVTGSLFAVAEARSRYTRTETPKRVRDRTDATRVLENADVPADDRDRTQDRAIHRVVETTLHRHQADVLERELVRLGGDCARSGIRRSDEAVDAVLMGTHSQFEGLIAVLEDRSDGFADVIQGLRTALEDGPTDAYPWQDGTAVMGILNVTPDSFHDGGAYDALEDALARAEAMIEAGADVVDVGGESTRPGADPVPIEEEIDRVVPVIERLADLEALVSVDTRKAAVAEAALEAGADVVNDVSGLEDPEMRFVAAEHDAPIVLMHSIDAPVVPGRDVSYDDVVDDAIDELTERVLLARKAGLDRDQIVVDPGLGFGKSARESFELLGRIDEFHALGCPVLVGHSHKSMFEAVDCGPDERRAATVAATALAADRGVDLVRVHDVPENVAAVKTALAARDPGSVDG
ncbi:dihydropteroate synthase [Natrialbaceae archaeon AArc-T1-2]|uniref:dihydropteroate synthase n=1 Tax=Natrialbaceae archaeon AArc-T1-2 TaxID=3053904 RepID=UPI00255ACDCC|nr:dihydropteroate synthase [Natrialbaceae archaeon AArc-T1-2]WIV67823.1 dihydropteroate synthase [Natrialbaceae archaeon AArc-T1-2]